MDASVLLLVGAPGRGYGSGGGLGAIGTIVIGAGALADGLRVVIGYRKRIEQYLDPEGDWH